MEQLDGKTWFEKPYHIFRREDCECYPETGRTSKATIRYTQRSLGDCRNLMARWPLYAIRGKPVPRDIAREIIRRTDGYLYGISYMDYDLKHDPDYTGKENGVRRIFRRHGIVPRDYYGGYYDMEWFPTPNSVCCGWCHPDGYIGINGQLGKIPFLEELLDLWAYLIDHGIDGLDLVVAVTNCDGRMDPSLPFDRQIVSGYHVKEKTVELLTASKAQLLYRRYDRLYGDHRPLGPLADPRVMPGAEEKPSWSFGFDAPPEAWGIWGKSNSLGCNYLLHWGDILPDWPDRHRREGRPDYLPPLPGGVDKNNPVYYGVPDYTFTTTPLTMADMEEFVQIWQEEQTGLRADGLAIAAVGEHGLEQVTDLETTDRNLLFVLADYVDEEAAAALAACRARLSREGKTPFFVRACHGDRTDIPMPEGLFDLTVICGRWTDLLLKRPAEIIAALTRRDALLEPDPKEALRALRRPGTMFCFEKSAERSDLEKLCNELEWEAAVGRAKYGPNLRIFVRLLAPLDVGLDEVDRCAKALLKNGSGEDLVLFQCEVQDSIQTIAVQGMIGAWDGGEEAGAG